MSHVNLKNITPGEILLEDYMKPMGLSQNALARALDVPPRRINAIIHGKRAITLDTSLRLARYFEQSPRFWLNIQNECDLRNAEQLQRRIFEQVRPRAAA
ncbi:MAG TPA: HigA family addiction module antitoxin [Chthoniobacteraceae bacterium]|jgi:addiction module HigA family antidote|nr:HigA family addiction module antitoxin [Chthoniobacteraceae bacterium]